MYSWHLMATPYKGYTLIDGNKRTGNVNQNRNPNR